MNGTTEEPVPIVDEDLPFVMDTWESDGKTQSDSDESNQSIDSFEFYESIDAELKFDH